MTINIDVVLVRARAFTQMLGYAIEVYKQECAGVLMGDVFGTAGKVVVNSVVALQSADRGYTGVRPIQHRYDRITQVLSFLSLDWILGEFHSHTDYKGQEPSYRLSEEDREYIYTNHYAGEMEMVVALGEKKRTKPWGYIHNKRVLRGTLGNYDVEIGVYYKADDEDDGTLTEVRVPVTEIANIATEIGLPPSPGYIIEYIPPQFHASRYRKLVRSIQKYEDKLIKTGNPDAGKDLLASIERMMRELAAVSEVYEE